MSNTGGPAFPTSNGGSPDDGMTLRDYFAGQAMAAVNLGIGVSDEYYRKTAKHCYAVADAMLKEREQK
tara:strand:+ start:336 stop:539 length:204 start_codon:yes stop_codon:yes gene_type:complete